VNTKIAAFLSLLSLLLAIGMTAFITTQNAQGGEPTPSAWTTKKLVGYQDYPVKYTFGENCTVIPHASGDGVMVNAIDENWHGNVVEQHFVIKRGSGVGTTTKDESWSVYDQKTGLLRQGVKGYDVFYVKCRDAAKNLPLAVRKAFLGYYALVNSNE